MMCYKRKKYKMTDDEFESLMKICFDAKTDKSEPPEKLFKELKESLDNKKLEKRKLRKEKIKKLF